MLAQKFALRWGDELTGLVLSGTTLMVPPFLPPADLNAPFAAGRDRLRLAEPRRRARSGRYVDDPLCGFQPDFPFEEMAFLLGGPTDAVPPELPDPHRERLGRPDRGRRPAALRSPTRTAPSACTT